ncbi:MAG TPA: exonuclease domain-containing protein [Thermoleophilaceae bacterium]|nr:exonuclease domain-containing protein [Thermoleophilaceae bacterium]
MHAVRPGAYLPWMLSTRLSTAEFVAVDTETNGRPGDLCELTEVGAVLVGGGELHERFESLVAVQRPLSTGIQRFTGITQEMAAAAPPPEDVLPRVAELLDGRVLVAHNASFDRRVLRQAFDRAGLEWPDPPAICTVSLARRFAPLARQRKLAALAASLGIEVEVVHRALADAETCARIFCALQPKLCAHAVTVGDALGLLSARRRRGTSAAPASRPRGDRPDLRSLPADPGVYIFRDERGRPLYVGKSVSVRSRARAHFCAPAGWTEKADVVDYRPTNSELGALVLENRLIKEWQPPGNVQLKRTDGWVYLRCRLDIAFPVLEVAGDPAPGHAVNIGPLKGRDAAADLADELSSLYGLRHCGRTLSRRAHPSIYGQMGRCVSPCLGDLDPNAYRRRLDEALALFDAPEGASKRVLGELDERIAAAAAERRYEAAGSLLRRQERLAGLLGRLDGVLRATHAQSRLALARHPAKKRWDAFWLVGGRVVDWGPLPDPAELAERTEAAAALPPARALLAKDAVDEVRIVAAWLAGNDAGEVGFDEVAQRVPRLQLRSRPSWPEALLGPLAPGAPP